MNCKRNPSAAETPRLPKHSPFGPLPTAIQTRTGISRGMVQHIEKEAMTKLRAELAKRGITARDLL